MREDMKICMSWDSKELLKSETFQNDSITKGVNELNKKVKEINFKCDSVGFTPKNEDDDSAYLVDLNGYIVTRETVIKLITEGIIELEE